MNFYGAKSGEIMTIDELNIDEYERLEESEQEIDITPEIELALGRVLLPVFAEYLQEMGFLESSEYQNQDKKDRDSEMTIEETVNKIAGAQLGHTFRLSRIEEGFQQIAVAIQQLSEIVSSTDGQLEGEITAFNDRLERTDAVLEKVVELQNENAARSTP